MNLKTTLITLSCIAGLLIIITFYVVFYGSGGTYVVSSNLGSDAGIFATSTSSSTAPAGETASSTTSSTLALALALASSSASSTASSSLSSTAASGAAAVTWTQGNETLSVVNASVSGLQLTLGAQVTMGSISECVPLTLRMIADEQGDLSPPITSQFTFPDTGTCNGTPGETYSAQPIVFTLNDPATFPILLTTGGTANVLFEIMQGSDGSLSVQLPPSTD
jgi:hypothetical protein